MIDDQFILSTSICKHSNDARLFRRKLLRKLEVSYKRSLGVARMWKKDQVVSVLYIQYGLVNRLQ